MPRGASHRRVSFATEVQSIRQPRDDELFVMLQFSSHASHCSICNNPYAAYCHNVALCARGLSLGKDVATYVYARGGKPYSCVDRQLGERVQIEIPAHTQVISLLVKAINHGMVFSKPDPQPQARKPIVVPTPGADKRKIEAEKIGRPSSRSWVECAPSRKQCPQVRHRRGDVKTFEGGGVKRRGGERPKLEHNETRKQVVDPLASKHGRCYRD